MSLKCLTKSYNGRPGISRARLRRRHHRPALSSNCGCEVREYREGDSTEDTLLATAQQLIDMGWHNVTDALIADLNRALMEFDITTPERIWHFISQSAHESGLGRWTVELASGEAYEWRSDLGNTQAGDGPTFRGAGYIQLTGRYNYQLFADFMGDPRIMEGAQYVAESYPWTSAGFWWHNNNMNALVDSGATVRDITLRVNGGTRGLAEREEFYAIAFEIFR